MRRDARCSLSAIGLCLLSAAAQSQQTSVMDGDWRSDATWTVSEPTAFDDVFVHHDVSVTLPGEVCAKFDVTSGGTLTIASGELDVSSPSGCLVGGAGSGGSGSLVQNGGTLTSSGNTILYVGGTESGSYTIRGGALDFQGFGSMLVSSTASAVLTIEGAGATIDLYDFALVGGIPGSESELVIRPTANGAAGLTTISCMHRATFVSGAGFGDSVLTLDPSYAPQVGDSWVIATAPIIDGPFDIIRLPPGITATDTYTGGQVILTITDVGPSNDDCANAIALPSTFADTPYSAFGATTDGADATGFCDYGAFGDEQNHNDVWFTYTPAVGGCTYISTLGLAGYDTRLTVYEAAGCPDDPATILACVDDEEGPSAPGPFEAGLDVNLQAGVTYTIRLGTFDAGTAPTSGTLRIAAGPGAMNTTGPNPGAPGCVDFPSWCNGDGGDQMGCTDCPCGNNAPPGTVGGCLHSASALNGGFGSRLLAEGDASVSLPSGSTTDLKLSMENMPPVSTCVMFSGSGVAPTNMANPCFGYGVAVPLMTPGAKDGLRCAVGGLIRHGNRQSDAAGNILADTGPSRTWGGVAGPVDGIASQAGFVAGQTRYFQGTHRDLAGAQCGTGLNTSQAVEVTFTP